MDRYLFMRLMLNFFELLACASALIYFRKIRNTGWKWFAVYLFIITITEIFLEYNGYILHKPQLTAFVNFYFSIPFEFLFFLGLFFFWFERKKDKAWVLSGIVLYVLSFFAELFILNDKKFWFLSFSYTTGNIVLLITEFLFFYRFINSSEILAYRSSMMFWISTGLLIFFLGSFPFYGLWNTLAVNYPTLFNNYWMVAMGLGCVMYLFFCFSFIWGKPK
jgi:hypothetical protein